MVAMPVFQERISPLFDVAKKFVIFKIENGIIKQKLVLDINTESEAVRIDRLKELGVSVIISGAVSCIVSHLICEKGLNLIPWVDGPVDKIIDKYMRDEM